MLVMLLWIYYGLPPALGIRLDVLSAGILGLALCDSAFEAEIFRAGIQSIEKGQHDAAESLGLNYWKPVRIHAKDVFTGFGHRVDGTDSPC